MLTYQYHCEQNGKTLEVQHRMAEKLLTWGEVCEKAGCDLEGTPADAAVERLISGGILATVSGSRSQEMPALPMAGCCGNPSACHRH